jgi:hypothetical protein
MEPILPWSSLSALRFLRAWLRLATNGVAKAGDRLKVQFETNRGVCGFLSDS